MQPRLDWPADLTIFAAWGAEVPRDECYVFNQPAGALYVERPQMRVVYDETKCILCERCLNACPTHAMEFRFR